MRGRLRVSVTPVLLLLLTGPCGPWARLPPSPTVADAEWSERTEREEADALRRRCVDELGVHRELLSQYCVLGLGDGDADGDAEFQAYCKRMRHPKTYVVPLLFTGVGPLAPFLLRVSGEWRAWRLATLAVFPASPVACMAPVSDLLYLLRHRPL